MTKKATEKPLVPTIHLVPPVLRNLERYVIGCHTMSQGPIVLEFTSHETYRYPTLFLTERHAMISQIEAFEMALDEFKRDPTFDFENLTFPPEDQFIAKVKVTADGWVEFLDEGFGAGYENLVWTGDENGTLCWKP